MTFTHGQLVVCIEAGCSGFRKGGVYRVISARIKDGIPAVALEEKQGHYFASRFRPISKRQIVRVNSIMRDARVFALLKQMSGRDAA